MLRSPSSNRPSGRCASPTSCANVDLPCWDTERTTNLVHRNVLPLSALVSHGPPYHAQHPRRSIAAIPRNAWNSTSCTTTSPSPACATSQHYGGDVHLNEERSVLSMPAYFGGQVRLTLLLMPEHAGGKGRPLKMRGAALVFGIPRGYWQPTLSGVFVEGPIDDRRSNLKGLCKTILAGTEEYAPLSVELTLCGRARDHHDATDVVKVARQVGLINRRRLKPTPLARRVAPVPRSVRTSAVWRSSTGTARVVSLCRGPKASPLAARQAALAPRVGNSMSAAASLTASRFASICNCNSRARSSSRSLRVDWSAPAVT